MDQVKEAFSKVKEDMKILKEEIDFLNQGLIETRQSLIELCNLFKEFSKKNQESKDNEASTLRHINSTDSTHSSTHSTHIKPIKDQFLGISTGNQGVPTDKQTDKQTDEKEVKSSYNQEKPLEKQEEQNPIGNALEFLNSLDNLKKEIRLKFKRLTEQEMVVFSTLYQLSEENGYSDYKSISNKLGLTESSIRDYVGRLIKKGIPVEKNKINNKNIQLSISPNLKKIASLNTILQLREI